MSAVVILGILVPNNLTYTARVRVGTGLAVHFGIVGGNTKRYSFNVIMLSVLLNRHTDTYNQLSNNSLRIKINQDQPNSH